MRDIEVDSRDNGAAWRPVTVAVAATSLWFAGCSMSLPGGSFVSGGVGEPGPHLGERKSAAAIEKGGPPASPAAISQGGSGAGAASSSTTTAAIADLARAHAAEPRSPQHALAYSRALKREGKRSEALAVLETTGEADPKHPQVRLERGLLTLEVGQTAKAEGLLREAVKSPEPDWRAYSALGVAASSQGRQKEAQTHFSKALSMSPNNPSVLNNMAVSLLLDRQVDQAEAMLRRASKATGPAPQQVKQNLALARVLRSEADEGGHITQQ